MIVMEHISKRYKVARRSGGAGAAVKSFLRREHEWVQALDDVSFTIRDGEMIGYMGPNGAGKSSTIKILSGILTPDSGRCTIDGLTPWKNRIEHVKRIGVVFGQRSQLWWDIPVIDSYELLRDIYSIPKEMYRKNLEELTELLQLDPAKTVAVGDYHNDIPMFKAAGVAIAVGNACPEVIAKADFVTVHHEEHAIAKVIHDLEEGTYGI